MRRLVAVFFAVVAAMSLAGVSTAAGGKSFSTDLSGAAEVTAAGVPNQGDPDGSGQARIVVNRGKGQVCWSISVTSISLPATAAHIHVAPATTTGPVVVTLTPPGTDGMSSGCVSVGRVLVKAIAGNPSNYYVNVHNADFSAGALRGQLG